MRRTRLARWAGVVAAAFLLMPLSACDEILKVDNPEEISVTELNNEELLDAQVAGVLADFQDNMSGTEGAMVQGASFLGDETLTGLNWEDWQRNNQRIVEYNLGAVFGIWARMSAIVRQGQETLLKLDSLSDNPASDRRVALVSAWTGYGLVFIADHFCQAVLALSPDSLSGELRNPDGVYQLAIPFFERAITVGTAAGDAEIVNLAHVGLARTHLALENYAEAISNAQQVPAGYVYWVEYSDADSDLYNNLYDEVRGTNHTIGVHPAFLNGTYGDEPLVAGQTDPRVQHTSTFSTGHDQSTKLYKPYQPRRFSGYTGAAIADGADEGDGDDGDVIFFQRNTNVMLADYVEAQHHMYEAMLRSGGSEAQVNAFVNARRAVGNEGPVSLTGDALFTELRRQRALDHFMGGLRLGDLRRWKRQGVGDFFPTGAHPNPDRPPAVYGVWTCWALPLEEYEGNSNLQKPADPTVPPGI